MDIELRVPREGTPALLRTPEQFADAAHALSAGRGPFAIDTERASAYRYDDRAFVVQVRRHGAGTFLFAPEGHRAELGAALEPVLNGQQWIIHAAPSDLPCLGWLGLSPGAIFDTELAARLCGCERSNLAFLVSELLGFELAKQHGAADWSQPDLPQEWLDYAALDVEFLAELAQLLETMLRAQNKWEWAQAEFSHILATNAQPCSSEVSALHLAPHPEQWREVKGVRGLKDRRQLQVARTLWQVRDSQARAQDTSPARILSNRCLVEIAYAQPESITQLKRISCLPRRASERKLWWEAVETAYMSPAQAWPHLTRPQQVPPKSQWSRDYPQQWEIYQELRSRCEERADSLHLRPEVLVSTSVMRAFVWAVAGLAAAPGVHNNIAGSVRTLADAEALLRRHDCRDWQIDILLPLLAPLLPSRGVPGAEQC
ncbi:HRDC domain-containing protein [Corynebacterium lizhenjunii]|nr:HRDC domain-containing protein [Corynebacterium lizhenjunii]